MARARLIPPGLTLRARLLIAFIFPATLVLTLGGTLLYRAVQQILDSQLGTSLTAASATIATSVRAERALAITAEDAEGEGSRTYRSLHAQLTDARRAAGLRRVLVFDIERRARIDVGGDLPPLAEVPELLRDKGELELLFTQGMPVASKVLFEGTDGRWYKTGYAPIFSDGAVVAVLAVEGSAAFFGPLESLRNAFIGLALFTVLLLVAGAVVSARTLSLPLERLVASALRIGAGDLGTPVAPQPTREIGVLARELEAMRTALESRDRQLLMMLGGIAHEVKNPLGGIELFSGLIDEELRAPTPNVADALEHVRHVRRELDYLKRIVEDFLAFAREQKLNRTELDAAAWLEASVSHLEGEARAKNVVLATRLDVAQLEADERLLTGAIVNLVKNAIQASSTGQSVRITGRAEGDAYVVTVEDEGHGIAPNHLAHIFDAFFTTREKGSGLGLPLAKKLIEAHGGSIEVTSQPGATCFTVKLPTAKP